MLLFFEVLIFLFVGLVLGVYAYLWLMYTLNYKSFEWNVVTGELHEAGYIDDDELRRLIENPPWYVKLRRKFDVTERILAWADERVREWREKDREDKNA